MSVFVIVIVMLRSVGLQQLYSAYCGLNVDSKRKSKKERW